MNLKERLESKNRLHPGVILDAAECRKVLALLAAAKEVTPALGTAQREGGGTGYYAQKSDLLNAAIAAMEAE